MILVYCFSYLLLWSRDTPSCWHKMFQWTRIALNYLKTKKNDYYLFGRTKAYIQLYILSEQRLLLRLCVQCALCMLAIDMRCRKQLELCGNLCVLSVFLSHVLCVASICVLNYAAPTTPHLLLPRECHKQLMDGTFVHKILKPALPFILPYFVQCWIPFATKIKEKEKKKNVSSIQRTSLVNPCTHLTTILHTISFHAYVWMAERQRFPFFVSASKCIRWFCVCVMLAELSISAHGGANILYRK